MIFNAVIDGTPVNVELQSPTQLEFQIVQQQLEFQVTQPAQLEFQVVQPQIMFPLEVGVTIPGPISGLTWGEIPTGIIDGANKNYGTAGPYAANALAVYLNGIRQRRTNDYNETSNQTFQFLSAPLPGDSLSIDYIQP